MLCLWSILSYSVNAVIVLLIKCDPWSLIKVNGQPNLVIMFSYMNLVATSLEYFLTSFASSHLVTYSNAVMMNRAPVLLARTRNGPMKSIAQISNVRLGFTDIKGISVLGKARPKH